MTKDDVGYWRRVDAVLSEALELAPEERRNYLERACMGDGELRRRVEYLLSLDEATGHFLEYSPSEGPLGQYGFPSLSTLRAYTEIEDNAPGEPVALDGKHTDPHAVIGRKVSHYQILERLGGGGMGIVYKARDLKLDRPVALKFLPPHLSHHEEAKQRFMHEAKAASALDHPHIGTIYEIDETEGEQLFIVMAFYEGETLERKIARGPVPIVEALDYAVQIAMGLSKAHAAGIVHRDIKPANIMVTGEGVVKIVDFGVAKILGLNLTRTARTMGTAAYMSPEQVHGEAVDARTDLWSLGVVLYEMVTGKRPFRGDPEHAVLQAILHGEPEPVAALVQEAPPALEPIIGKALAKHPEARYQRAEEMISDLRSLVGEHAVSGLHTKPRPGKHPARFRAVIYSVPVLLLALLVAGVIYISTPPNPPVTSIAVLPLRNLSADPDREYLADAMTEALSANLSRISALERVISPQSMWRFKGTDLPLPEIARMVNVDALVQGAVLFAGERVHVTVRLSDRQGDRQLWVKVFERDADEWLILQSEVAIALSEEIEAQLTREDRVRLQQVRRVDPEVAELYQRGRHHLIRESRASLVQAVRYFEQAIARDSLYAPAYIGLAKSYYLLRAMNLMPEADRTKLTVEKAIDKAIRLDPNLPEAHVALADLREAEWDWQEADRVGRYTVDTYPGNSTVHYEYGWFLLRTGRLDEALREMKRALELDPLSVQAHHGLTTAYYYRHEYDKAIELAKKAIELDPNYAWPHVELGLGYVHKGRYEEAIPELERAVDLSGGDFKFFLGYAYAVSGRREEARKIIEEMEAVGDWEVARVHLGLGDRDRALDWLERAYREGPGLRDHKVHPLWDSLRTEPRFRALLEKMGLN